MKKYQIIYADPPWRYSNPKNNNPKMGGITYPTMKLNDICLLPIKKITDKNCALFLWATMPKLKEAFEVITAWGFEYRTCVFVWVKQNPSGNGIYSGLGHWTNGNAELVLFAKKGHPRRYMRNVKQIVFAPRSKHSQKPEEVRSRINKLMGYTENKLELFCRDKETANYKGWDVWGNEVKSDIEL